VHEHLEQADQLREAVRALASDVVAPHVVEAERRGELPDAVRAGMSAVGCFGRVLPREHGGAGAGLALFCVQQEELARAWPTAAVAATWTNLSGRLISRFGSVAQQGELLPGLAQGTASGAVAWTEPHGGSDAAGLRTSAVRVDGGWLLTGEKRLIDNTGRADFFIVGARTNTQVAPRRGITMFLVRRDDPGFVPGGLYETLGLRAAGVGWFSLDECFVADDQVLGEVGNGFYQMMDMVEFGRTGVAAICVGIAEAALGLMTGFLSQRTSFGRPLADSDVVLSTVADLRIGVDAARLLMGRAAELADAGVRCDREAAMAKVWSSEVANNATAAALQFHGGIGYTTAVDIERLFRDSRAFTIGEGTSEVLRLVIGRSEFERRNGLGKTT